MARTRLHLTFPNDLVQEPIVYRLVRDYDLVLNIRRADVDDEVGWIVLELSGEQANLTAGRKYLEDQGVIVSEISGDIVEG